MTYVMAVSKGNRAEVERSPLIGDCRRLEAIGISGAVPPHPGSARRERHLH